jgi:HAD superfamily hydrolase (TIGR01509 family)
MNKISAVIFDMDGLMFDTEALFSIAQTAIAEKRGKKFTLDVKAKMMGQKPVHAVAIMLAELGINESAEEVFKEQTKMYVELLKNNSEAMPGLFELLDLLEVRGIRKGIATSSMRGWVDILLARFNIADRFEFIITGEEVKNGKPDPEMYEKAVAVLGLPASSCLVLEDSSNGIRSADGAGCFAVAVPSEFTKAQDFSKADRIVESLSDSKLFECFEV